MSDSFFHFSGLPCIFKLVKWLEVVILRTYEAKERAFLTSEPSSSQQQEQDDAYHMWASNALKSYLQDLGYHRGDAFIASDPSQLVSALDWLLTYAIDLEYKDNAVRYNNVAAVTKAVPGTGSNTADVEEATAAKPTSVTLPTTEETFTKLIQLLKTLLALQQPQSEQLENQLKRLCSTPSSSSSASFDTASLLNCIYRIIERRSLGRESDDERAQLSKPLSQSPQLSEDVFPLGFTTGAPTVDQASTILRLLYVAHMKQIQSQINTTLGIVQEQTANPTTDISLGQVGR
jgi:hypothetical protein